MQDEYRRNIFISDPATTESASNIYVFYLSFISSFDYLCKIIEAKGVNTLQHGMYNSPQCEKGIGRIFQRTKLYFEAKKGFQHEWIEDCSGLQYNVYTYSLNIRGSFLSCFLLSLFYFAFQFFTFRPFFSLAVFIRHWMTIRIIDSSNARHSSG